MFVTPGPKGRDKGIGVNDGGHRIEAKRRHADTTRTGVCADRHDVVGDPNLSRTGLKVDQVLRLHLDRERPRSVERKGLIQ